MAPATEGFDPVFSHLLMVVDHGGKAAPELDFAIIHQPPQTQYSSLFRTVETGLLRRQPADLMLGDHTGGQAFENDLPDSHESFVTDSLHPGAPRPSPRIRIVLLEGFVGVVKAFDLRATRGFAHQILALANGIDGGAFGRGVDAAFEFHQVTPDVIAGAGCR